MARRRFDIAAGGDSFSFLPETEPKIAFWLGKYPEERKRSAVIPMLWLAQKVERPMRNSQRAVLRVKAGATSQ